MSSRLSVDGQGRRIAVVSSPSLGLPTGARYLVLGNELEEPFYTGVATGRAPLPAETAAKNRERNARRDTPPRKWSDADREHGRELVASGLSWAQAAEQIGCPKATLGQWMRGAGRGANTPAASVSATPAPSVTVGAPAPAS